MRACGWRRLCPNSTGADIRSVCTEAGMFAIRARRKTVTEKDFLDAVNKVTRARSLLPTRTPRVLQRRWCLGLPARAVLYCIPYKGTQQPFEHC